MVSEAGHLEKRGAAGAKSAANCDPHYTDKTSTPRENVGDILYIASRTVRHVRTNPAGWGQVEIAMPGLCAPKPPPQSRGPVLTRNKESG